MIWKGLGILLGSAALIVVAVLALARITVPDEPTFAEELDQAGAGPDDVAFVPTVIGGQLEVTGAREGTIDLNTQVDGPTYGLGDGSTRVFFETDPLTISQMSYEDLAFFPEPGDCEFTEGEYNEQAGLATVQISCVELVDIRDNGSISMEGIVVLPADMVLDLDLPETGGTVTVGDVTFEPVDPFLFIAPSFEGSESEIGLFLSNDDASVTVQFTYDEASETLNLARVLRTGGVAEVEPGECTTDTEEIAVVNPQTSLMEVTFNCDSVSISGLGAVTVEGNVVFPRSYVTEH